MLNAQQFMQSRTPTQAEHYFRELFAKRSNAFKRLAELVSLKADECQWREFKEAKFINDPLPPESLDNGKRFREEKRRREDSVKSLWSENLSAFANTGGGVLIWGIDAPKRIAEGLSLAGDALSLAERLIELQNDAVDPPVIGVEVRAVTKKGSQQGFVVCYIPESTFSPHRALMAERDYYMRAGDSNRTVPTALLRRMFYPQFTPWLVPAVRAKLVLANHDGPCSSFHNRDGLLHIAIEVQIANRGNASAQETRIELSGELPCEVKDNIPNPLWLDGRNLHGGHDCKVTIHPGQTVPFLNYLTNQVGFDAPDDGKEFKLRFKVFAHNAPVLVSEVAFTGAELKRTLDDGMWVCRDALSIT